MRDQMNTCSNCGAPARESDVFCSACGGRVLKKAVSVQQPQKSVDDICDTIERVKYATMKIMCAYGDAECSGTGFFVKDQGKTYLITNYHVISGVVENGGAVSVSFPEYLNPRDDAYITSVIGADPINDLALLDIPFRVPNKVNYLELADLDTLKQGQRVIAVGNPQGMLFNSIEGSIANTKLKEHNIQMSRILCNLSAGPGNSGGPVVRALDEKVIGVATAIFNPLYLQSHTICASADAVRQLIYLYERGNNR